MYSQKVYNTTFNPIAGDGILQFLKINERLRYCLYPGILEASRHLWFDARKTLWKSRMGFQVRTLLLECGAPQSCFH